MYKHNFILEKTNKQKFSGKGTHTHTVLGNPLRFDQRGAKGRDLGLCAHLHSLWGRRRLLSWEGGRGMGWASELKDGTQVRAPSFKPGDKPGRLAGWPCGAPKKRRLLKQIKERTCLKRFDKQSKFNLDTANKSISPGWNTTFSFSEVRQRWWGKKWEGEAENWRRNIYIYMLD